MQASMHTPGMKDSSAGPCLRCPHEGKREPFFSRADDRMGNRRICVFENDAPRSSQISTLAPAFSTRCIKTNKQQKNLEHCPPDKEHPVSWSHSTSGGLMLLLSNAWPGDTVILCLTSLQRESWHLKETKKLLHVMPVHPLPFHWKVWEHVNDTDMSSCSYSDVSHSLPVSMPLLKTVCQGMRHPTAPFIFYFCSARFSIKILGWKFSQGQGTIREGSQSWRCLISPLLQQ